jgi:putative transposase
MTGQTEKETIKIGTNVNLTLIKYIKRRENIKTNKNIPVKIKKKNELIINRKILNKVDDLQWKTINFLTINFTNILLGDMSAKSIVSNNKSVLSSEMKSACLQTRFYEFGQRLKYKCEKTKTNFQMVNEMYTSKTCSLCGNYNDKLKGEKVYNCSKCDCSIDRDINGCRNILMKYMMVYLT